MCRNECPNNEADETGEADCSENHQAGSGELKWIFAKDRANYQQKTK
jgi:hypothetical protein